MSRGVNDGYCTIVSVCGARIQLLPAAMRDHLLRSEARAALRFAARLHPHRPGVQHRLQRAIARTLQVNMAL